MRSGGVDPPPAGVLMGLGAPPRRLVLAHWLGAATHQRGNPPAVRNGEGCRRGSNPHPDLLGRVLPVAVLTPHDNGVTPHVVLRVGVPPLQYGAVPEMVLARGTTESALLEAHSL